jgi:hypothetical protein
LIALEGILLEICDEECILANSVCEGCGLGIGYYEDLCESCEELIGSSDDSDMEEYFEDGFRGDEYGYDSDFGFEYGI